MNLHELVNNEIFDLPLRPQNLEISHLNNRFADYKSLIDNFIPSNDFENLLLRDKHLITNLCEKIINSIDNYLLGRPSLAYSILESALDNIVPHIQCNIDYNRQRIVNNGFYKLRVSDEQYLAKEDMFHIPFNLRSKVQDQRYSIYGLPCLYLGSSTYVCWEELHRPSFNNLFISKFKLNSHAKVFDLKISKDDLSISMVIINTDISKNKDPELMYSWLISKLFLFPLVLSCSIRKKINNYFKEEYIIPQLLLEWIVYKGNVDAIEYFSTSLPDYNIDHNLITNYVFPVKTNSTNGFCPHLSELFSFCQPISWNLLLSLDNFNSTVSDLDIILSDKINIYGKERFYVNTDFYKVEQLIDQYEKTKL